MFLIQLTETDKRVIFAIFLLVILIFVLIGYIGYLVTKVMKYQGSKLDTKVYDVVTTRVITDKKAFKRYARKKNWQMFYKSAQIPILIMICAGLVIMLYYMINHFEYSLFDPKKGFATILFIWDFDKIEYNTFLGVNVWKDWPPLNAEYGKPEFVWTALPSYIGVFALAVGLLWYLYDVQALIARGLRIRALCDKVFEKSLEGFNQNNQQVNAMSQQIVQNNQPQQNVENKNINL